MIGKDFCTNVVPEICTCIHFEHKMHAAENSLRKGTRLAGESIYKRPLPAAAGRRYLLGIQVLCKQIQFSLHLATQVCPDKKIMEHNGMLRNYLNNCIKIR